MGARRQKTGFGGLTAEAAETDFARHRASAAWPAVLDLDGDFTIAGTDVAGEINAPHPAFAKKADDPVRARKERSDLDFGETVGRGSLDAVICRRFHVSTFV